MTVLLILSHIETRYLTQQLKNAVIRCHLSQCPLRIYWINGGLSQKVLCLIAFAVAFQRDIAQSPGHGRKVVGAFLLGGKRERVRER